MGEEFAPRAIRRRLGKIVAVAGEDQRAPCAGLAPQTTQLRYTLPPALHEYVELKQVPFFPQTEYQCGPAALATVLNASGVKVTPDGAPLKQAKLEVSCVQAGKNPTVTTLTTDELVGASVAALESVVASDRRLRLACRAAPVWFAPLTV